MVFNIASAGLIWTAYQQNMTVVSDISSVQITYTEYALAITEMVFIIFGWFGIICLIGLKKVNIFISCPFLVIQIFNIVFSAYLFNYHDSQAFLPMPIINMALAIIILNSLALCGCCVQPHKVINTQEIDNAGTTSTASNGNIPRMLTLI